MKYLALALAFFYSFSAVSVVNGAVSQGEEGIYLANFNRIMEASYSQVDDMSNENLNKPPPELLNQCKNHGYANPTQEVIVNAGGGGTVSASSVQSQCRTDTICIIPEGTTLTMDGNLNFGALIVRGVWNGHLPPNQSSINIFAVDTLWSKPMAPSEWI